MLHALDSHKWMLETTQNRFLLITDTGCTDTVTVFLLPCDGFTYPLSQPYQEVQAENGHSHIKLLISSYLHLFWILLNTTGHSDDVICYAWRNYVYVSSDSKQGMAV